MFNRIRQITVWGLLMALLSFSGSSQTAVFALDYIDVSDYSDVSSVDEYYTAILYMGEQGVMTGSDGQFESKKSSIELKRQP